jgi:hypothetical protein
MVYVPVAEGVSAIEPLVACVPDHAPDAVQSVAFVAFHAIVVDPPTEMVEGVAVIVTVGAAAATGLIVMVAEPHTDV